ncbi:peptidase domain-containing ABC transporter [Vibrio ulleungensis]|uniref:Peptidase domain-containing ABC transporter n=1 Tax=Vibrio ulleungensis TaxID=2807619 RepID=A0ABS2HNW0_9VIBR|nr:peptidase domain-containing ABC transporter [Vibrio ulleungensis]MBM7037739.1 peptidase domain-containing ABC transporter [Vibrio ulleungensis]
MSTHTLLKLGTSQHLPVVRQTEAAECGLACLAMVAHFHGYRGDLTHFRQRFSVSNHGVNLKQLMSMASQLDLIGRALQLDMEHLSQLQTPCVLHWDMNHFVVLKHVDSKHAVIHDPATGQKSMSLSEFSNHFTGIALELTPSQQFAVAEFKQTLRFHQLWSRITGLKRHILQILLLSLLLQIFSIASPFYMQTVIDDVLLTRDTQLLAVLAIGFALLMLVQSLTEWLRGLLVLHLSSKLSIQMAANLFRHMVHLPMDYFEKRHMGDIVSRFGSLHEIKELLSTGIVSVIVDGLLAIVTLVMMLLYSVKLTLIVLASVTVYALLRAALYRPIKRLTENSIISHAKENSNFMETVRAIQSVKVFGKESERQNLWHNRYADAMNQDIAIGKWTLSFSLANALLFGIENILVVYFAATAVMGNILSIGMLYAFMSYKNHFTNSIDSLISKGIEIKMLSVHLERLADIALTPTETAHSGIPLIQNVNGQLCIHNISYRYSDSEPPAFTELSFTINAGDSIAITGPSGCGKTTLVKCLMGLLTPSSGTITIDGSDIHSIDNYREQIAAVMQDDHLVSGSIADNVAFFDPNLDRDWLVECATMANVHDDIMTMPMNYNTLIGDMGAALSGGQKQRVLLARALYRRPKILFLDEATSHLDVANEAIVNENIKRLNITRVIVAHRPETILSADRVLEIGFD